LCDRIACQIGKSQTIRSPDEPPTDANLPADGVIAGSAAKIEARVKVMEQLKYLQKIAKIFARVSEKLSDRSSNSRTQIKPSRAQCCF
jgi:hypothetical protein